MLTGDCLLGARGKSSPEELSGGVATVAHHQ